MGFRVIRFFRQVSPPVHSPCDCGRHLVDPISWAVHLRRCAFGFGFQNGSGWKQKDFKSSVHYNKHHFVGLCQHIHSISFDKSMIAAFINPFSASPTSVSVNIIIVSPRCRILSVESWFSPSSSNGSKGHFRLTSKDLEWDLCRLTSDFLSRFSLMCCLDQIQ